MVETEEEQRIDVNPRAYPLLPRDAPTAGIPPTSQTAVLKLLQSVASVAYGYLLQIWKEKKSGNQ